MKKLLLLSTLLLLNCTVFGQSTSTSDTISKNNRGLFFTGKIGFARIWESGNGPLYGFTQAIDGLYSKEIGKRSKGEETYLQAGLGFLEFDGNRNYNGNTAAIRNFYLQIPLKVKIYRTLFRDQSKKQQLQSSLGYGIYANTMTGQRTEGIGVNTSAGNLGWNWGVLYNLGLKYTISKQLNLESGFQFQIDLSKMKKDGVERKTDYIAAFYLDFKFL